MDNRSEKPFVNWNHIAAKTAIAGAVAGALGGVASDAQAWWFFCKQDCEERADQRYNYRATQCEATRQEADKTCDATYRFGSQEHQDCRQAAQDSELECISQAQEERNNDQNYYCDNLIDCS